ncbi:prolyl-tRNA synthetase associated domain-containing protein [Romboutsia weinsteinii]|uniref:prolyl-tRNA synthetase associated domain-containing protein n=1 Tax=Romboutsia weinsteinii TaxID=2020949 RepID=UPI00267B8B3A|nr:prolyl-tRNA synthetase associated domain-containing protein [Romboutsia weinsteinii]
MINETEQKVYNILDSLNIEYKRYEHQPVYTIEDASKLNINIPGTLCKNLFLRNNKGNTHYLVIIEDSKRVNLKSLSEQINSSSLSFASEERLDKYLGLKPGSVSPFGLINDINKEVIVLIDKDVAASDIVSFHPNVNTCTIGLSYSDFEKFVNWHENKLYTIYVN